MVLLQNQFSIHFLVNCHFTYPLPIINLFLLPSFFVILLASGTEGRMSQFCVLLHFCFFKVNKV